MILSDISSHSANSRIISLNSSMVALFIVRVSNRKTSAISSLHLIFSKGKDHFWYIEILQLLFCFCITMTKYCLNTPKMVYFVITDQEFLFAYPSSKLISLS